MPAGRALRSPRGGLGVTDGVPQVRSAINLIDGHWIEPNDTKSK